MRSLCEIQAAGKQKDEEKNKLTLVLRALSIVPKLAKVKKGGTTNTVQPIGGKCHC